MSDKTLIDQSIWGQLSICDKGSRWRASFHLDLCWLCACLAVRQLNGCSSEHCWVRGSSSYTLNMARRWRIPEASSLIDSSVPFLPRPRYAESCYCPTKDTQASKQYGSLSCTCSIVWTAAGLTWMTHNILLFTLEEQNAARYKRYCILSYWRTENRGPEGTNCITWGTSSGRSRSTSMVPTPLF